MFSLTVTWNDRNHTNWGDRQKWVHWLIIPTSNPNSVISVISYKYKKLYVMYCSMLDYFQLWQNFRWIFVYCHEREGVKQCKNFQRKPKVYPQYSTNFNGSLVGCKFSSFSEDCNNSLPYIQSLLMLCLAVAHGIIWTAIFNFWANFYGL